jgi:Skp family chaperone for outer membrane proteins
MKEFLRRIVPALLVLSVLSGSAWAQGRVATVDLDKLMANYWKYKQARAALEELKTDLEKEDRDLRDTLKKATADYQKLLADANDQAISADERDKRKKATEARMSDLKNMNDAIVKFEASAQSNLASQSGRSRDKVLEEIRTAINAKAKSAGYALVLDTSAKSANRSLELMSLVLSQGSAADASAELAKTPGSILYASSDNDITDELIKQLNAGAPVETPKPTAK